MGAQQQAARLVVRACQRKPYVNKTQRWTSSLSQKPGAAGLDSQTHQEARY